jgi:hypothetical protein
MVPGDAPYLDASPAKDEKWRYCASPGVACAKASLTREFAPAGSPREKVIRSASGAAREVFGVPGPL